MKLIRWMIFAFSLFTLLLTLVFFSWWAGRERISLEDKVFDQVLWMRSADTLKSECQRGNMARHLQQQILTRGMPRTRVAILLGRPNDENIQSMEYELGRCAGAYYGLRIFFDENDRLLHSRILTH